ncbi:MAG: hypothetical protein GQ574_03325 [Crocinitomix sp.]|nr:hypothetical protein [Crocinitomix sp.]
MKLLQSIRQRINSIFDYYIDFDRSNFVRLFATTILVSLLSFVLVIATSYFFNGRTYTGQSFTEYAELYGGIFGLIAEKAQIISAVTLLNYALIASHFLSFSRYKQHLSLTNCVKGLPSKKWSQYFFFLVILSLTELYPSPYYYGDQWSILEYSISGISSFADWSYELVRFLAFTLMIVFAFVLAKKEVTRFSVLKKEPYVILTAILLIFSVEALNLAFTTGVDKFIGNFFVLLDSKNLFGIVVGVIKVTTAVIIVPSKIVSLSNYASEKKVKPRPIALESEDLIDDFE